MKLVSIAFSPDDTLWAVDTEGNLWMLCLPYEGKPYWEKREFPFKEGDK